MRKGRGRIGTRNSRERIGKRKEEAEQSRERVEEE